MAHRHNEDISRYLLPEMKAYVYCFACLALAKKKSKKVKALHDKLVESFGLPEMKAVQEQLKSEMHDISFVTKILNEESEPKLEQARKENKLWFPDKQAFDNVGKKILSRGFNPVKMFFIRRRMSKSGDVNYLETLCEELIKVGFNKESDQIKRSCQITAKTSPKLVNATLLIAFGQSQGVRLTEKNGQYTLRLNGKYYDLTNFIAPKTSDRGHRLLTKSFKDSGYSLEHGETIVQVVEHWYGCRVLHSGIEEYCNEMAKKGIVLNPGNISNSIKECDEAMGYPRGKR